jgi:RNA polymerase sigma-70 factor, ECF subfamily
MTPPTPRRRWRQGSGTPILLARITITVIAISSMANLLSGASNFESAPFGRQQTDDGEMRDSVVGRREGSAILPFIPAADHPHATAERDRKMPDHGGTVELGDAVYDRYYRLLCCIALRDFGIPRDDVEPLAHDAFVALLRNRHRITSSEVAWLVGVMYNLCRDYWRAKGQEERARLTFPPPLPMPFDTAAARVDLERALSRLPDRYLAAIQLRFFEGLSIEEIAQNLGIKPDNAKQIIHRGLLKARQRFTAGDDE